MDTIGDLFAKWLRDHWVFLALLVFQLSLLMIGLSSFEGRKHGDEELHLRVIEESLRQKHWFFPFLDGRPFFNKPPLLFWLSMVLTPCVGSVRAASRLVVVGFFGLTSLFVYLLSLRLQSSRFGHINDLSRSRALLSVTAVASSLGMFYFSRLAMLDIPMLASLLAVIYLGWRYCEENRDWLFRAACFFIVIGNQWKGPVFTVFLVPTLLLFIIRRKVKISVFKRFWFEIVLTAVLSFFWEIAMAIQYGEVFLEYFFVGQSVGRMGEIAILTLCGFLFFASFPWSFYFLTAFLDFKELRRFENQVILTMMVGNLIPFLRVSEPHFHWLIPMIVGMALLPWAQARSTWLTRPLQGLGRLLLSSAAVLLILACSGIYWIFPDYRGFWIELPLGFSFAALGFAWETRGLRSLIWFGVSYFAAISMVFFGTLPLLLSPLRVPTRANSHLTSQDVTYLVRSVDPSLYYVEQFSRVSNVFELKEGLTPVAVPRFPVGSLVVVRAELLGEVKQPFQKIMEWKKARDGLVPIPWGAADLLRMREKSFRDEQIKKMIDPMVMVQIQ